MSALFPLRPLQQDALTTLRRSIGTGKRRPVIQAPCGFGKTVLAAYIVTGSLAKRKRVAFVVPMLSLIDQTFDRFVANGISAGDMGVTQGNHAWRRPHAPIQICSVQTIAARGFPEVDHVLVDEAHVRFKTVQEWMADDERKLFIGFSATPWARGMGDDWDDLIVASTVKELIALGWLSPFRVFAPSHPDLSEVKTVAGDYHEGQLSAVMSGKSIVADVVQNWLEHGEDRPTLCFAVDLAHAAVLHEGFSSMGVTSAYIDANTTREERVAMIADFQAGRIKVICSVGTMTTGVDVDCRCLILARPTKSEILYVQIIGRGLRTAPGKVDCLIFDHSDTTMKLGMVTDIHHDRMRTAASDEKAKKDAKEGKEADKTPTPRECQSCHALIPAGVRECPGCGKIMSRPSAVVTHEGELTELGATGPIKKKPRDKMAEPDFIAQLRGYAKETGKQDGWVAHKFKAKYGVWPNGQHVKDVPAQPCGPEVKGWIRSQNIAFAHSKGHFRRAA